MNKTIIKLIKSYDAMIEPSLAECIGRAETELNGTPFTGSDAEFKKLGDDVRKLAHEYLDVAKREYIDRRAATVRCLKDSLAGYVTVRSRAAFDVIYNFADAEVGANGLLAVCRRVDELCDLVDQSVYAATGGTI